MNRLLPFRAAPPGASEPCFDLSDLLGEVVQAQEYERPDCMIPIHVDSPPYVMVHADRERLRQVFTDLLVAHREGQPAGSEVLITVYYEKAEVEVEIEMLAGREVELQIPAGDAEMRIPFWIAKIHHWLALEGASLRVEERAHGGSAYLIQIPRPRGSGTNARQAA